MSAPRAARLTICPPRARGAAHPGAAEIKVKVAAPKKETKLKVAPNAGKGDSKPAAGSAQPKPVKRPAADVISGKDINYGAAGRPDSWRNCNSELWGPSVVGSITLDETTEGVDYCNREKIRTRMVCYIHQHVHECFVAIKILVTVWYSGNPFSQTFTPEVATPRPAGSPVPGPSKKPRRLIADSRLSNSGSELEDSSSSDQEEMNQSYAVDMRDVICELREVAVLEEEGEVEAISCVSTIATIVGEMETIENVEGRVDGATGEDNAAGDFDASFSWSDDFSTFSGQEEQYTRDPGPRIPTENILDIFNAIWDLTIISLIVEQTNLYAWQTIAKMSELGALPKYLDLWVDTTVEEIRRLFSIMIYMSLNHRARLSEYWSTGTLGMPDFRKLMSKNRFQLLMRFLHFSDNDDVLTGLSGYQKKITKIAPILNHMNKKFAEICIPQRELSLDESLLLWKGRLSWEQFIRSKAARYGLKLFDLCEAATGYLIRTIIYAGKDSSFVEGALHGFDNKSAKVVLELMDGFLDVGHLVVMDNWYNQLALTRYLKKRQTDVLGTINKNRQQIPLAIKNLDEKRMQRGQQVACHCGDIAVIAWKDVKLVTVISTYHSNEQVVGRRSGQELIKPVAIDTYNKTMGGVDLKDMKLSNFPIERKRGRKWYMKVFVHFLNTSILNSYIIYCKNPSLTVKSHRDFRYSLADLLIRISQPVFVFRPNKDTTDVRLDRQPDHFPTHTANVVGKAIKHQRLRCRRCVATGKRTLVMSMCQKCKVALCLGKCWIDYHTKDKLV
ncbi:hypothetical protein MSG28_009203 [Choristoneura fumiferana]|uniref:Uncharacterized protein n=1 Tax=Choristoneura fumiferana TaxID=7141 RepID=A0ACC0KX67_CHOFU|nr:hypothetical protein MSG28_009203 [Choristoneura fumiferana]